MRTADPGKVSVCVKLEAFNSPTAALEIVVFGGGARGGGGAQSVCSIEERREEEEEVRIHIDLIDLELEAHKNA